VIGVDHDPDLDQTNLDYIQGLLAFGAVETDTGLYHRSNDGSWNSEAERDILSINPGPSTAWMSNNTEGMISTEFVPTSGFLNSTKNDISLHDICYISQPTLFCLEPNFQDNLPLDPEKDFYPSFRTSSVIDNSSVQYGASTRSENLEQIDQLPAAEEKRSKVPNTNRNLLSFDNEKSSK
jgi:hypothetical protein